MHTQLGTLRRQRGFTLVEMVIVVIVLGILAIVAMNSLGNTQGNAQAKALFDAAQKTNNAWMVLRQAGGIPADPTDANPAIQANNTALDVLMEGETFLETSYQSAYEAAGIAPLSDMATITTAPVAGTSAGAYEVNGFDYDMALSAGGDKMLYTLADVPTEIVKVMWEPNMTAAFDATADTTGTGDKIQHTTATGGVHDLTIALYI